MRAWRTTYPLVLRGQVDSERVIIGWDRDHRTLAAANAMLTNRPCQQTTKPHVGWGADDQGPGRLGLLDQDRTGVAFDQLQLPVGTRLDLGVKRGDAVSVRWSISSSDSTRWSLDPAPNGQLR